MEVVYKGRKFSVEVGRKRFPNGQEREVAIIRHPVSVVMLPIQADGRVILIKQYRVSVDRELWEMPAGTVDPGEGAEEAAVRECEEEIGLVPHTVQRLQALFPTPGSCDEELIFFRVTALRPPAPDSTRRPDDDEDIRPQPFTVAEARAMVARGEIIDLKTAYGLTLL